MQHRMKQNPLADSRIHELLETEETGRFVTVGTDGYPYATPVHYVYDKEKIYFHGLPKGQKLENLSKNSKVCFEIDKMYGYLKDGVDKPCDVNTDYESVIITGDAKAIDDFAVKKEILRLIVRKYAPELAHAAMPDHMVKGTAVVEISIKSRTGKYFNGQSMQRGQQ